MGYKTVSFYDWCIANNYQEALDLWDYELNNVSPKDVSAGTAKRMYFKCPRGIHESELYTINNITGDKHQRITCRKCHSFGQWCLDNNQNELLERWDCELNDVDPFYVPAYSGKKYYFKCPVGNPLHPSELKILGNVVQQERSRRCIGCESFGQWCIDNVDKDFMTKYWSDINTINPFTITSNHTKTKVWIKCQNKDYHDDYEVSTSNFKKGKRCPYCAGKKVNYYDSLGYNIPQSVTMWSDRNKLSPFDYTPHSNKSVWFHCDIHGDYKQIIADFTKGGGVCRLCWRELNISKLQYKVETYITEELNYQCLHEYDCNIIPINPRTGYKMPFDNEIPDLKLIIEVNGSQHYECNEFTYLDAMHKSITPEQALEYQQWKDKYKMEYALEQGYYYLEIPYYFDDNDQTYKKAIKDKINNIISSNNIQSVTTAGGDEQSSS